MACTLKRITSGSQELSKVTVLSLDDTRRFVDLPCPVGCDRGRETPRHHTPSALNFPTRTHKRALRCGQVLTHPDQASEMGRPGRKTFCQAGPRPGLYLPAPSCFPRRAPDDGGKSCSVCRFVEMETSAIRGLDFPGAEQTRRVVDSPRSMDSASVETYRVTAMGFPSDGGRQA